MPVYQRAHAAAVGQSKGKPMYLCCVRADGLDVLPAQQAMCLLAWLSWKLLPLWAIYSFTFSVTVDEIPKCDVAFVRHRLF